MLMESDADLKIAAATRLLVVEDDAALSDTLVSGLERKGYLVRTAADGDKALDILSREGFDVVVMDLKIPRRDGIAVLQAMRADGYDAEVIIVTGHAEVETAIEALKLHAFDYLAKPFRLTELYQVVARAVEHRRLRHENRALRRAVLREDSESAMRGRSPAMERLRDLLTRAGRSGSHVLIQGESGSGKELAARHVHRESDRNDRPFLAVNCAAMADELLESELFGHEKGAFTGAAGLRQGLLELAHEGTLFLDEVAEMSQAMQAKLLRALDSGEIRRLGGSRTLHVDVRIIAASNRRLDQAAAAREFRHDLFFRLSVVVIETPPLRERLDDIPPLVDYFARRCAPAREGPLRFTPGAMLALTRYGWPGNVRELRNVVERLAVMTSGAEVTAEEVVFNLHGTAPEAEAELATLEEEERRHILRVLKRTDGNRAQAAKILGVDPKTLYNKLKAYLPRA